MDENLIDTLERIASAPRLKRYRDASASDFDAVVLYCWNIALAESLMPSIAILEVTLRNQVHRTLTELEGTEWWFQRVLNPRSLEIVAKIERDLERRHGAWPSTGKIIADLSFGFWPKLFAKSYHSYWWRFPNPPLMRILPEHPNVARDTRSKFETRLEYFSVLRNRIMHQEAVFDGVHAINRPRLDLDALHLNLIETIGWLDGHAVAIVKSLDRYPDVSTDEGRRRIAARLQRVRS